LCTLILGCSKKITAQFDISDSADEACLVPTDGQLFLWNSLSDPITTTKTLVNGTNGMNGTKKGVEIAEIAASFAIFVISRNVYITFSAKVVRD
jgi:hypothetical protein